MSVEHATSPAKELTNDEKLAVRTTIFQHLAGIVLAPVVKALADRGVFARLADAPAGIGFGEMADQTHCNRGYLRVALRLLVSCGWMAETGDARYALTPEGKIAVWLAPLYSEVVSFIPKAIFLDDFLFGKSDRAVLPHLQDLARRARARWGVYTDGNTTAARIHRQTARYLDGTLIGPGMVALAREGIFDLFERDSDGVDLKEVPGNP